LTWLDLEQEAEQEQIDETKESIEDERHEAELLLKEKERLRKELPKVSGEMRDLADIVEELEDKLADMSEEEKNAYIESLGLSSQTRTTIEALMSMTDEGKKGSEMLRELADDMAEAGTATYTTNEIMETAIGKQRSLQAELYNTSVDIGSYWVPAMEDLREETEDAITSTGYLLGGIMDLGEWAQIVREDFDDLGDSISEVSYGKSPGGLVDIIKYAEQAKESLMGLSSATGMSEVPAVITKMTPLPTS